MCCTGVTRGYSQNQQDLFLTAFTRCSDGIISSSLGAGLCAIATLLIGEYAHFLRFYALFHFALRRAHKTSVTRWRNDRVHTFELAWSEWSGVGLGCVWAKYLLVKTHYITMGLDCGAAFEAWKEALNPCPAIGRWKQVFMFWGEGGDSWLPVTGSIFWLNLLLRLLVIILSFISTYYTL
jgi:hypothetical protein